MNLLTTALAGIATLIVPLAAIGATADPLPANPLVGGSLFIDKGCIRCHSIMGIGGQSGPDLGRVHLAQSQLTMAGTLWNHSPRMTQNLKEQGIPRPAFTVDEMSKLTTFLYLLSYFDPAPNIDAGRKIFFAKRCAECHVINARKDFAGDRVDLGHLRKYTSPMFVATSVWNHGPQMVAKMKAKNVPLPTFNEHELNDLIGYIKNEGTPSTERPVLLRVGNPQRGQEVFSAKGCVQCHKVNGGGSTSSTGPDLGKSSGLNKGLSEILTTLWHHGPRMWEQIPKKTGRYPTFTVDEMNDLITYLYFLPYHDRDGDPGKGEKIFFERGCLSCHTAGQGRKTGPDLADSKLSTDNEVLIAIWNHLPAMEESMESAGLAWPIFQGTDMADLIAFLRRKAAESAEKRPGIKPIK